MKTAKRIGRFLWELMGRHICELAAIPFLIVGLIILAPVLWVSIAWDASRES